MVLSIKDLVLRHHNKMVWPKESISISLKPLEPFLFPKIFLKILGRGMLLPSVYLINRLPSKNLDKISSFEILYEKEPDYNRLSVFGCKCFVLTDKNDKLSPKAIPCAFLAILKLKRILML